MADEAPLTIPIFPLAGVLLLPGGQLPLNIFEPRYLQMVRDAMAGNRVIGMVQPTDPLTRQPEPPVYSIGCTGRISAFKETDDHRFLITLTGQRRFKIEEELSRTTLYRQVLVTYDDYPGDASTAKADDSAVDRPRLLTGLKPFLQRQGMKADWAAIEAAPTAPLVATLAMVLPFEPSEKQALLEAMTLADRATLMTTLIEMALRQGDSGGTKPNTLN